LRGVGNLEYDENFNEYFIYLNVYSNEASGEEISFKIWDAGSGGILQASIDGELTLPFIRNEIIGTKSIPAIFENTGFIEQNLKLNKGWTWISLFVEPPTLSNLNALTSQLRLENQDMIKSQH